jgi:glutathione S-transferase
MSQPTLDLLEHPLSPYAQKLKIAMAEKGLAFTARTPDAIGSGNTPEQFRRDNFRGEVPVLYVDSRPLFDSTVILEFLEDRFPEPSLRPADAWERARARTIEEVVDTHYEAITWGLSEIRNFKRATGELAERMERTAGEQLGRLNAWLEKELGEAEWFGGERFGWADACVAPFVQGATGFGFGPGQGTALHAWLGRCRARPSVATAFEQARAAAVAMAQVAGIVEAGLFKRQYRDYRLEWMIRSGGAEVVMRGLERDNIRFNTEPA